MQRSFNVKAGVVGLLVVVVPHPQGSGVGGLSHAVHSLTASSIKEVNVCSAISLLFSIVLDFDFVETNDKNIENTLPKHPQVSAWQYDLQPDSSPANAYGKEKNNYQLWLLQKNCFEKYEINFTYTMENDGT